jgi:putative FmdB family regulatory protein
MKKLFEFQCRECKEISEQYTEYKQLSTCPSCGSDADKIISAPRVALEGISGSFPGAAWAWEKKHNQQAKKEIEKAKEL